MGIVFAIIVFLFFLGIIWAILRKILGDVAFLIPISVGVLLVSWLVQLLLGAFDITVSVWSIFFVIFAALILFGLWADAQSKKQKEIIARFFRHHQMGDLQDIVNELARCGFVNSDKKLILQTIDELIDSKQIEEADPGKLWKSLHQGEFVTKVEQVVIDLD